MVLIAALVAASDPWASSQSLSSEPVGGDGVDSAGTGMGWVAAAVVGGFVLRTQLSGLWCSLTAVFRG